MKKLNVLIASPGLSGAGLIYDYLLSRNDFTSPFKNYPDDDQQTEFRFVSDPGGLNSLYHGLYKNFSVNNSSYVFKEFEKYINKLKKLSIKKKNKKKFIYTKDFFTEVEKFKKKIIKVKYYGLPQYYRLGFDLKDKIKWRIIRNFRNAQNTNFLEMQIPVEEKKFILEAKKLVFNVLKILSKGKNKNYAIDQAINFWKPEESSIFFSNKKIILITRDPRSVFSSMKKRESLAYPGHDVKTFIEWYKNIMKLSQKITKKNIFITKYENFILNHKLEEKRLLNFLGLKSIKQKNFNLQNSTKNIFKKNKYLKNKNLKIIEKKLKKYLQWPKKIYI
mgnify:CR=1 FL=1